MVSGGGVTGVQRTSMQTHVATAPAPPLVCGSMHARPAPEVPAQGAQFSACFPESPFEGQHRIAFPPP